MNLPDRYCPAGLRTRPHGIVAGRFYFKVDTQVSIETTTSKLSENKKGIMTLGTILIILAILVLLGALPTWGYSSAWGYGPSGIIGVILVILIILVLLGRM
jgi:uncharacterized membrane-anchored protein